MTAGDLFAGVHQREVPIRQYRGKAPLCYQQLKMTGALFTADLDAIQRRLPDRRYHPLVVLPGRGLVALHCFEYERCDIGPYNEVALTIAVQFGRARWPSPLAAVRALLSGVHHGFITELPVTTEVALFGGLDYFGFPKFLAEIDFRQTRAHRICTLRDGERHELILEFEGTVLPTRAGGRRQVFHTYPQREGQTLHAQMMIEPQRHAVAFGPGRAALRLGSHCRGRDLAALRLGLPLVYFYAPRCQGLLLEPEPI